jgi:hypothetical protein
MLPQRWRRANLHVTKILGNASRPLDLPTCSNRAGDALDQLTLPDDLVDVSGLQIFNAHPALYLGEILEQRLITTGILGVSKLHGEDVERAFPSWATVPSGQDLATARRWHFFFAWFFVPNDDVDARSQGALERERRGQYRWSNGYEPL